MATSTKSVDINSLISFSKNTYAENKYTDIWIMDFAIKYFEINNF